MTIYKYNPHRHIKIWLSNNPNIFMNLENQVRLSDMREKNPRDEIYLIYDATILTAEAIEKLYSYCTENKITAVNADTFTEQLKSKNEHQLFEFYKDEIQHLKEGGNLAVASDILRWLAAVYTLGTYTDFDFPIDTSNLPLIMDVQAPLLLNIGSVKIGKKEFLLANNDYIAVVNEKAAKKSIDRIQLGIISRLKNYDTDFIEKVAKQIPDNFINRRMLNLMKNRGETLYISKSKEINKSADSSRKIRNYIKQIMSAENPFIEFKKEAQENDAQVIKRLRIDLKKQLNLVKYIFFKKEHTEIKNILQQDDDAFINYLMNKELNLYLKSIIVCTTGPVEICDALFGNFIVDTTDFSREIKPLSFHHYNLQKSFKSFNSIPMHENIFGMMRFLGVGEGELNDSSWLDSGRLLQEKRIQKLESQKKELAANLPQSLLEIRNAIQVQLKKISKTKHINLFKERRKAQKEALEKILYCFRPELNEFDVDQFKAILLRIDSHWHDILDELFFSQTKNLVQDLEKLSHNAVVFGLTQNRKIKLDVA